MSEKKNGSSFLQLLPHARLIRMEDCCALINRFVGSYVLLEPLSATIIAMCNGSLSLDEIIKICANNLFDNNNHKAQQIVHDVINKCEEFLDITSKRNASEWIYYPPNFLYETRLKSNSLIRPLEKPLQMTIVLTNRCNFNCLYCFRDSGSEWEAELSKDEIFRIIDQAAEMELKYCSLTGGEPTLHPYFEDIVIKLIENDIYPYISSNGTLISEKTLYNLKKAGLQTIQFSIDSGNPEMFDKMVGKKGYFPTVINSIKTAKRLGYFVRVKAVATKINAMNLSSLFDVCADCNVDFVHVEAFSPGFDGRGNEKMLLPYDMALELKGQVEQAKRKYAEKMIIASFTVPKKWTCSDDIIYCGGMYTSFVVQPDGTVCACEQVSKEELTFGNIREQSLKEIWNSPKVLKFLNPNMNYVKEPCKSCKCFERCRSGCFNYSLMYSNSLYAPDPRCWKVKLGKDDPLGLEA